MTPPFDSLVRDFFYRRLIEQQGVSRCTIEAYRDTFRLLLDYLPRRIGKAVPSLCLEDLDTATVLAFLEHLETERGNGPRTRNARLAALRSFCPASSGHPDQALRQAAARLPDPRGDASRAERAGRLNLGREKGPGVARRDV
jgi:integrase/recombinase XerD